MFYPSTNIPIQTGDNVTLTQKPMIPALGFEVNASAKVDFTAEQTVYVTIGEQTIPMPPTALQFVSTAFVATGIPMPAEVPE